MRNQRSDTIMRLVPGAFDDAESIATLVGVLCTDDDLNVVEDATWVLVKHGGGAVTALLEAIAHSDVRARHNIVHALGRIGDPRAVPALIAATEDVEARVRMKAVYVMGQIGDARAVNALVTRLSDPVPEVANTAREVVGRFGGAAFTPLIDALNSESAQARELAADLLGELGDTRAVELLIAALVADEWEVRVAVLQALGSLGDARALIAVDRMMGDPHSSVRAMARAMAAALRKRSGT